MKKNGYITLISMLIISAVGLSVALSLILLGVGSSRSSFTLEQGGQAKILADMCAEQALQQIWNDDTFVGTVNGSLGQGSCSYTISGSTAPKVIAVTATMGEITRRLSVTLDQLRPYLHPSVWQDVP